MKCVIVTGAAGGIGAALVDKFLNAGYRVVGIDAIDAYRSNEHFHGVTADLSHYAHTPAYRSNVNSLIRDFCDGDDLCGIINNAAIQRLGNFEELDDTDWKLSMDVNVLAPVALIREFLPDLSESRGSAINIASIHAKLTKSGFSVYSISKAALVGLTSTLAIELGGRIQVMAICPAAIATPC